MNNLFNPWNTASYGLAAKAIDPIFQATISWPGVTDSNNMYFGDGQASSPNNNSGYVINPYTPTTPIYNSVTLYLSEPENKLAGYDGSLSMTPANAESLNELFSYQTEELGFAVYLASEWGNFITAKGFWPGGLFLGEEFAVITYPNSKYIPIYIIPHSATTGTGTVSTPDVSDLTVNLDGISNTNLSNSTVISNYTAVNSSDETSSSLKFVFEPGSVQSLSVTYSHGATIDKQITNGIANSQSNSNSSSDTSTTSGSLAISGSVFGIGAKISASVSNAIENAWSQSSTQETNFSTSDGTQTSTMTSDAFTFDINSINPNANGDYFYGDTQLIPGQAYIASIQLSQASIQSGISQAFQINSPVMSAVSTFNIPSVNYSSSNTAYLNAVQAIEFASTYGYNFVSGIDNNLFQYTQGQNDYVTYSGLVTATSNGSAFAQTLVQAVANLTLAYTGTSPTNPVTPAVGTIGAPPNTSFFTPLTSAMNTVNSSPPINATAKLDLSLAAERLTSSANGVYFDTTQVEDDLVTLFSLGEGDLLTLDGGYQHTVHLGDLSHTLSKFTNSYLTAGNGNNTITIAPTENGNIFILGDGNNSISLDGEGNNIFLGKGSNFIEVAGGTDTNFIIDDGAPTAILFSTDSGFIQVSGWDPRQDSLHFGPSINLSDVVINFNNQNWSYDVYINDNLVANLLSVGGLSLSDPTTSITTQSWYAPTSIALDTNEGFLTGLYAGAFSRAPDFSGFNFWSNGLLDGTTRIQAIQDFFTSAEFEANFASTNQYVEALYNKLLGRSPDELGLEFWTEKIDNGTSHETVVYAMLNNAEFINLVDINYPA